MRILQHRSIVALLALAFSATAIYAAPIDINQAKEKVAQFRNSNTSGKQKVSAANLSLSYTAQSAAGDCFYIFNSGSDGGYTIVAADDRITDILGYSDKGSFDPNNIPDNMKWWLSEYQKEIEYYLNNEDKIQLVPFKAPEMKPVEPITTTKWNQSAPYNDQCPIDSKTGLRSVTGCVATAMAQVMKCHNWPLNPTGSANGVTFTGTTFDWDNMIDVYESGKYTTVQANAVSTLMRQCGASVAMNYSSSASGAYSYNVPVALYTYFGYNKGMQIQYRNYYHLNTWNQMVYTELTTNGPLYYSGSSSEGGHAFVCDGYQGNGYFHFNWGWGGYQDGYFRLFALNPSSGGIGSYEGGYNSNQAILLDVKKSSSDNVPYQALMIASDGYTFNSSTMIMSFENSGIFYNPTGRQTNFNIGAKVTNIDDPNDSTVFGTFPYTLNPNYGFRQMPLAAPTTLADGTYKLNIVYQDADTPSNEWKDVMIPVGQRSYILVTKSGSTITYTNPTVESKTQMIVNDLVSMSQDFYVDTENYFNLITSNVGNNDFYGNITVAFYKSLDAEKATRKFNFNVMNPAGISITTPITQYIPIAPGDYYVKCFDPDNNLINDPIKVTFKDYTTPIAEESSITANTISPNSYTIGGGYTIGFTIYNSTSSTVSANVGIDLYSLTTNKKIAGWNTGSLSIVTGSTKYRYKIPLSDINLKPGYYYWRFVNRTTNHIISENTFLQAVSESETTDGITYSLVEEKSARVESMIGGAYQGTVTIPATLNSNNVTSIASDAFTFCDNLKEISLPSAINSLSNGMFYGCTNLEKISLNATEVPAVTSFTFAPESEKKIELNVVDGLANLYKRTDIWSEFFLPSWEITLDSISVSGLAIDTATNAPYAPYYVNATEQPTITYTISNGEEVSYQYSIGNGNPVTVKAENGKIILPALGKENGKIRIYYSKRDSGINSILGDSKLVNVFTTDGLMLLRNANPSELNKLAKGIYIINGKKVILK